MRWLVVGVPNKALEWELVKKDQTLIRGLESSPPRTTSPPSGLWTHWGDGRVACLGSTWKLHTIALAPYFALCISSIWLFLRHIFYNKQENISVFLSSVSHPGKSSNQKRGLWKSPDISVWSLYWKLLLVSEVLVIRGSEPLTCRFCANSNC